MVAPNNAISKIRQQERARKAICPIFGPDPIKTVPYLKGEKGTATSTLASIPNPNPHPLVFYGPGAEPTALSTRTKPVIMSLNESLALYTRKPMGLTKARKAGFIISTTGPQKPKTRKIAANRKTKPAPAATPTPKPQMASTDTGPRQPIWKEPKEQRALARQQQKRVLEVRRKIREAEHGEELGIPRRQIHPSELWAGEKKLSKVDSGLVDSAYGSRVGSPEARS
jgi:hypothetical protein